MVARVLQTGSAPASSESADASASADAGHRSDTSHRSRFSLSGRAPGRRVLLGIAVVIALIAFGIRIAEISGTAYTPIGDAGSYLQLGSQITQHGDYANTGHAAGGTRGPTAYYAPAYPYLIAGIDELTGHTGATANDSAGVHAQRITQAVIGTFIVILIGLIAYELFGSTVALVALAMAAVYPVFVALSAVLTAENVLTMLELLATWLVLRALKDNGKLRFVALAGVAIGLATLTHTNGVLLLIPLGIGASNIPGIGGPRRFIGPATLVLVALLTMVPWLLRDENVMHHFVPISDEAGITLIGTYNASSAHANPSYRWQYFANLREFRKIAREAHRMREIALDSKLLHFTEQYVTKHPTAPLEVAFDNGLRLLELEGSHAWRASAASIGISGGTAQIGVLSFWLLAVLAIVGAFMPQVRGTPGWLWLIPVVMALSVLFVNAETPRFRETIDPFLILLAACTITTGAAAIIRAVSRATSPPNYDVASRIVGS